MAEGFQVESPRQNEAVKRARALTREGSAFQGLNSNPFSPSAISHLIMLSAAACHARLQALPRWWTQHHLLCIAREEKVLLAG